MWIRDIKKEVISIESSFGNDGSHMVVIPWIAGLFLVP